jgi:hypothetical protein
MFSSAVGCPPGGMHMHEVVKRRFQTELRRYGARAMQNDESAVSQSIFINWKLINVKFFFEWNSTII